MIYSLADRIERTCGRFLAAFGINPPKLTADQWTQRSIHTTQLLVRLSKYSFFRLIFALYI
jgi:hypothetical protein